VGGLEGILGCLGVSWGCLVGLLGGLAGVLWGSGGSLAMLSGLGNGLESEGST